MWSFSEVWRRWRDSVRGNPSVHPSSLNGDADRSSGTGQRGQALEQACRAVEIDDVLARDGSAAHLPDLAMSLYNDAVHLSEMGQRSEALEPARRAVEINEVLARDDPAAYLPDLAMSYGVLGDALQSAGQVDAAVAAYSDALTAFCQCRASAPDRFGPYLDRTARRLAACLIGTGSAGEIEPKLRVIMGDEVYETWRDSRSDGPEDFSPGTFAAS